LRGRSFLVALVLALSATPAFARSAEPVGYIKVAVGSVVIVRNGAEQPASVGQPVYETDTVKTGVDGRAGLTLKDDTRVALGPASEVAVHSFTFAPAEGRLGLVLKFMRGAAAYVSGRIAKLSPDAVRLETPSAIVGVRGTTLAIRVSA
jgi:hypothetical protein